MSILAAITEFLFIAIHLVLSIALLAGLTLSSKRQYEERLKWREIAGIREPLPLPLLLRLSIQAKGLIPVFQSIAQIVRDPSLALHKDIPGHALLRKALSKLQTRYFASPSRKHLSRPLAVKSDSEFQKNEDRFSATSV